MNTVLTYTTILLMMLTLGVLSYGIIVMLNPQKRIGSKSNQLMRLRLIFQTLALLCFGLLLWIARHT